MVQYSFRKLSEIGVRWVRIDFGWGSLEYLQGQYQSYYDSRLIQALQGGVSRPV
jgi:hypothetical protein